MTLPQRRFCLFPIGQIPNTIYDKAGVCFADLRDEKTISDWNAGKLDVGLIHPASAGHGLNLQDGGSTIIWYGPIWSLELYQQTNARLWRQGQKSGTVVVMHIVADDTIDGKVLAALRCKENVQNALLEAVKAEVRG
jgi:SNF2 family DNA or RNA helicase